MHGGQLRRPTVGLRVSHWLCRIVVVRLGAAFLVSVAGLVWLSTAVASSSPARTDISFLTAPEGPASAFSGLRMNVVAARARRITDLNFNGRDHVLLVAPTLAGSYCTSLSGPYGGTGCPIGRPSLDPGLTGDQSGPIVFHGSLSMKAAARLVVTYQDRSRSEIPFFWVSAPISAGFFVYQVPTVHRHPGDRPDLLSVYDRSGKVLIQQKIPTTVP
jgi:hypothetical protein